MVFNLCTFRLKMYRTDYSPNFRGLKRIERSSKVKGTGKGIGILFLMLRGLE